MKENFTPNGWEDGVPQFEEFPGTGKEKVKEEKKELTPEEVEKIQKRNRLLHTCHIFLVGLSTGIFSYQSIDSYLEKKHEKDILDKQKIENIESDKKFSSEDLSDVDKMIHFFANSEMYKMRGDELKEIIDNISDVDLVESFFRGEVYRIQLLKKDIAKSFREYDQTSNQKQTEIMQIDSLIDRYNELFYQSYSSGLEGKENIESEQEMNDIEIQIDKIMEDSIVKEALERKQRYEDLLYEYNKYDGYFTNPELKIKGYLGETKDVAYIKMFASKLRSELNTTIDEYVFQSDWISKIMNSNMYKKKLENEFGGHGKWDDIYKRRIENISKSFLIYSTDMFSVSGSNSKSGLVIGFYEPGSKDIHLPTFLKNESDIYDSNLEREKEMSTLVVHERQHQSTEGNYLMSDYAYELYLESFDSTRLNEYETSDVGYYLSPAERDARKRVLEYEMDQLGIKKYDEIFKDEHIDILYELLVRGGLSRGSEEFLRMTKKEYLKQIFNTIALNQDDIIEEEMYANYLRSKDNDQNNVHLFEIQNPEKALYMKESLT